MQKKGMIPHFLGFVVSLIILLLLVTACGNETATPNQATTNKTNSNQTTLKQGDAIAHGTDNIDRVSAPDTTQTTPTATAVPIQPVTVNWNTTPATVYTVGWANLRSTPFTSGAIMKTVGPSQSLITYGTVSGEILGNGPTWYRVTDQNSAPQYVYSDLITASKPTPVTNTVGKVIKVNLTTQHIFAYENNILVHDNLITSGQPGLLTPIGTFTIISKLHPTTFYSPWPKSSPYYYAPLAINYALGFQGTLLFLHDAYWRGNDFGPGTNVPHTAADGTQMTGSHGCVEMPTAQSAWFYNWAPIGTPLIISY